MPTRSLRWMLLAAQICVLAMSLALGGCHDQTYTDRFGIDHYGLSSDQVDQLRAQDAAAEVQRIYDQTLYGDVLNDGQMSVNVSSGPNISLPAPPASVSSPSPFCTPPFC